MKTKINFVTFLDRERGEIRIVETELTDGNVKQRIETTLKTREKVIREALIELGWTPPPEERSNEDASTGKAEEEIDRGGMATAWGDLG